RQRGKIGRPGVVLRLLDVLRTGDRGRHFREHENPPQRELRHARARGDERTELVDGLEAGVVVDATERLADVERLAVAIVVAMIARLEGRVAAELPAQQPAGERDAGEDA